MEIIGENQAMSTYTIIYLNRDCLHNPDNQHVKKKKKIECMYNENIYHKRNKQNNSVRDQQMKP